MRTEVTADAHLSSQTLLPVFEPSSQLSFRHSKITIPTDHKSVTLICGKCGKPKKVIQNCGKRSCEYCRNRVVTKILLRKGLNKGISDDLRFMTLTLQTLPELNRETMEKVRNYFRKMIRRVDWKKNVLGGLYVIEVTRVKNGYHYHFHVLYYGYYFPWDELRNLWKKVTGHSWIVSISRVQNSKKAYDYCLRYITKCEKGNIDPTEYEYIFARTKLVQFFGCWTKLKGIKIKIPCGFCGEDRWITEFEITGFFTPGFYKPEGGDSS